MMPSILILCPDNTCLSKIAKAYLQFFIDETYKVVDAGVCDDCVIDPTYLSALASDKLEIDLTALKEVKSYTSHTFDYLLTLDYTSEFSIPEDVSYKDHHHYRIVEDSAEHTHEQNSQMIVEDVKRAVLHFIGGSLITRSVGGG